MSDMYHDYENNSYQNNNRGDLCIIIIMIGQGCSENYVASSIKARAYRFRSLLYETTAVFKNYECMFLDPEHRCFYKATFVIGGILYQCLPFHSVYFQNLSVASDTRNYNVQLRLFQKSLIFKNIGNTCDRKWRTKYESVY